MTLDELYKKAFYSIKEGTIESVQVIAYEYFHFPIAICDTSFEMLAPDYPKDFQNDEIWDIPNQTLRVPYEHIQLYLEHDLINRVVSSPHQTVYCNWGWFKEHPRLTTGVFIEDKIVAYIAILLDTNDYPEEFNKALQIIADAFSMIFIQQRTKSSYIMGKKELYSREIFSYHISDSIIQEIIKNKFISPKQDYQIIAANYSPYQNNFTSIINQIEMYNVLYAIKNDALVILTNHDNDYLIKELCKMKYKCALSMPFDNIKQVEIYEKQALECLKVGEKYNNKFQVYHYIDYALEILVNQIKDNKYFIHPVLYQLKEYDKEHNSNLYETLKTYIRYQQQPQECYELLNIHRNTLSYRLKKIEDIGKLDIKNQDICTYLYISFVIESI